MHFLEFMGNCCAFIEHFLPVTAVYVHIMSNYAGTGGVYNIFTPFKQQSLFQFPPIVSSGGGMEVSDSTSN